MGGVYSFLSVVRLRLAPEGGAPASLCESRTEKKHLFTKDQINETSRLGPVNSVVNRVAVASGSGLPGGMEIKLTQWGLGCR